MTTHLQLVSVPLELIALVTYYFEDYILFSLNRCLRVLQISVMQYAEGGTMERMIQEQKGEKFSENAVLDYFTQVVHI